MKYTDRFLKLERNAGFDVNKKKFPVSEPYKQLWRQGVPLPFSLTLVFTKEFFEQIAIFSSVRLP